MIHIKFFYMYAILMYGWGDGGARGRKIVAGLTDRNVVALFLALFSSSSFFFFFFFFSNTMIKITLIKFKGPSLKFPC